MNVSGKLLPLVALGTALVATVPACAAEYNIVMLDGLTNVYAFAGVPMANGAKFAVERINASGALGVGNSIKLRVEDTGGDKIQATTLVNRFGNDPANLVMLGPLTTNEVTASAAVLADVKIPEIVVGQDVLQITPFIFQIVETPQVFMRQIAQFAVEKLGVHKCAFVTNGENSGLLLNRDIVRDYVSGHGVTVVADERVMSNDADFAALSTKIVASNPDCLSLSLTPSQAANVIVQMRQAGIAENVKIIGSNGIASGAFIKAGGKAVEGVYAITEFVAPGSTEQAQEFSKAYTERYGSAPDSWAAIGYAEVQLAAAGIEKAGPNPTRDGIREALTHAKDIPIVLGSGKLSVGTQRETHFGLTVVQVRDGKYINP